MQRPNLEADLERLHPESFGWALACCRWDRAEAEEVIQTAYLKVLDGSARFDGRSTFKTWLFAVIRRTAGEQRRRIQIRNLAFWRWRGGSPLPDNPSPEAEVYQSQATAQLVDALSELPSRQRQVLHLTFYQGLSIREAAEAMGVSLGTARQHYERGKRQLRSVLRPELRPEESFG